MMQMTRLVLKVIALSLAAAAAVCVVVAYWDSLVDFTSTGKAKFKNRMAVSDYDDYEE
ncbi:MAG: hypothetical protein R3Y63_01850 [Eubacteriales bacterium]